MNLLCYECKLPVRESKPYIQYHSYSPYGKLDDSFEEGLKNLGKNLTNPNSHYFGVLHPECETKKSKSKFKDEHREVDCHMFFDRKVIKG